MTENELKHELRNILNLKRTESQTPEWSNADWKNRIGINRLGKGIRSIKNRALVKKTRASMLKKKKPPIS